MPESSTFRWSAIQGSLRWSALYPKRALYLTAQERTIHDEAATYAERYRKQAEQLNEREAASRWQGAALSDNEVRRIPSFLKSYNEIRKGEKFVQREVRGRGRMRNRWMLGLGLGLVLVGLIAFTTAKSILHGQNRS